MKKIIKFFFILIVIAALGILGFFTYKYFNIMQDEKNKNDAINKAIEKENADKESANKEKEEREKYLKENVYDNEIPISLYIQKGSKYVKASSVYCDWSNENVLGQFYAIPSQEEEISGNSYKSIFKPLWEKYETEGYKIGYNLKLHFDTGDTLNRTLLDPIKLSDEIFRYIQLYTYDDMAYDGTTRYYHLSPEEVKETTLLTSLKLVGSTTTPGINGPIELTVFTYNGDEDFDSNSGEYIGKSVFTAKIYREKE